MSAVRGNPHAAFDAAGAGNVAWSRWCDTRRRKSEPTGNTKFGLNRRASPRPYLRGAEGETPSAYSPLSQDHGLGLVLSLHRAGRLLALHCRLEALCDRVCVITDRGMISAATITGLEERKLEYILGARERSDAVVRKIVLENDDPLVPLLVERKAGETQLFVKQVKAEGVRYVVCRNEAEAENDART